MPIPLGQIIEGSKSGAILGVSDRDTIIEYIRRAIDLAQFKANWNPWLDTIDLCSDNRGYVTLPPFVGTVLAANVGGFPATFRNSWYEFHINGLGSCQGGMASWPSCQLFWTDMLWSPVLQDLREWSYVAAICEDPIDGNGSLSLIVQGETMDAQYNQKEALTIPATGPSSPGVRVPLLTGYAATDPQVTPFKKITQVTKPVTRGYVKLIAFPNRQAAAAVTLGYYAPNETNPLYRRIRVNAKCAWVRCRFRRTNLDLVNDYDLVPFPSYEAMLQLLRAIRLRETNNEELAQAAESKALEILTDAQTIEDGPGFAPVQVDPDFGLGTVAFY